MDREVKQLKQSKIPIVKVRWNSRRGPEFTWEREDQMMKKYPHLFKTTTTNTESAQIRSIKSQIEELIESLAEIQPKVEIPQLDIKPKQIVFIARKAEFLESKFLSEGTSGRTVELEEVQDSQDDTHLVDTSNQHEDVENDHVDDQDTQNVRRSGRISVPPERYGFFMDGCYVVDSDEPTTYRDAMSKPDFDKWQEAMNVEMQSMYDNQVWELVTPLKSKVVGRKWVFKKKTDMHGNLDTYKARLVAKGYCLP
ncbi:hypothetical protein E3N88_40218 [Mikania micrantha]|uniref:Reverse transcriptase Ty1/copia-type domain-containing protein n=1 Tax=Mikania micrantha TaxID=192012 RepID=A0A5N6LMV2_9ASTR|nr:hypothetical protein E3N88_40218 [Mikania micrantha]